MSLPDGWPKVGVLGEKYRPCTWCGGISTVYRLLFDSGSVEPQASETLTGDSSSDTAVVSSVTLDSGSYAGGDAAGCIEFSSAAGVDDDGWVFTDNETVSGSTGGSNILTANGKGSRHKYGRLYPESEMIERDGKWYCNSHYHWYYGVRDWADSKIDIVEDNE